MAFSQFQVSGKVLDTYGQPYVQMPIKIEQLDRISFTNGQGEYIFKDIPSGDYAFSFDYDFDKEYRKISVQNSNVEYNLILNRRINFDEMTIVQSRTNSSELSTQQVISESDIQKKQTEKDIPYLLESLANIQVQSDAGNGVGYTDLRIRGIDPQQVQINLNGIPLNDAESSRTYLVDLPDIINSTEQITIHSGYVPSRSGTGAFGASVDLWTNKLQFKPQAQIKTRFGSFGTTGFSLIANSGLFEDDYNLEIRMSNTNSNGYIDRSDSKLRSFALSAVKIKPNYSLRLNLFYGKEITGQAWNGLPFTYFQYDSLLRYNIAGQEKTPIPYDNEVDQYSQTHLQLFYNKNISDHHFQAVVHYTRGIGFFENYKANQNLSDYQLTQKDTNSSDLVRQKWLSNHFIYASLGWEKEWKNHWRTQLAIIGSNYFGDHYGRVAFTLLKNVTYLQPNYYQNNGNKSEYTYLSKLIIPIHSKVQTGIDFQLRIVNYKINGTDDQYGSVNNHWTSQLYSPKGFIHLWWTKQISTFASLSYYQREPYREELLTNPDIDKEKLLSIDIGFKFNYSRFQSSINFYRMNYQNYLTPDGSIGPTGDAIRINADHAIRQGVEITNRVQLWNRIKLYANATFSQNYIPEFTWRIPIWDSNFNPIGTREVKLSKVELTYSPSYLLSFGTEYQIIKKEKYFLSVSLFNKLVNHQRLHLSELPTAELPKYQVWNSRIDLERSFKHFKLQSWIQISNLFDEKYASHGWYSSYDIVGTYELGSNPYEGKNEQNNYFSKGLFPQAIRNFSIGLNFLF